MDHSEFDRQCMEASIAEAAKCKSEDKDVHPLVGAVVARDGKLLGKAYRGECGPGDHAEFTVLEKRLEGVDLAGATVYTTLEPCTERRGVEKTPCAQRLVERGVARVLMGMLDPNPVITGRGQQALRYASVSTELYPTDLMERVEGMNRRFIDAFKDANLLQTFDEAFIERNTNRSLDEWYTAINRIYWNHNYHRDATWILTHLVEVVGGLSMLASTKQKGKTTPEEYLAKAIAWWLTLCGKHGVKSVEEMLWDKFPAVCAYCRKPSHDPNMCDEEKEASPGPRWEELAKIGATTARPRSLPEWQKMFAEIYPANITEDYGNTFGRLLEELGELAEAIRLYTTEPGYFLSEASDVFAWLMHIQNIRERKAKMPKQELGVALARAMCEQYPDFCPDCRRKLCTCPPILGKTIGRIAHEVPTGRGSFEDSGRFMTPDKASRVFRSDACPPS